MPRQQSILSQLFPQPSGRNGYEDLAIAADLLEQCKAHDDAQRSPSLTSRRKASTDPTFRRALTLVQSAFAKPIAPPEREMTASTTFPEFAGFRRIARALNDEIYVCFADGRSASALDCFRQGLNLGRVSKPTVLIGGLVGIATDTILLTRMRSHLGQCTPRDCDRLRQLLADHAAADQGNAQAAMTSEFRFFETMLATLSKDVNAAKELFSEPETGDDGTPPDPKAILEYQRTQRQLADVRRDPNGVAKVLQALRTNVQMLQDHTMRQLADPRFDAPVPPPPPDGTLERSLFDGLVPSHGRIIGRFWTNRVQVQLLWVHATIRRYQWEWDKLPENLTVLRLGEWGRDPFSGELLRYQRKDDTYTLQSIGPPFDGERTVVELPSQRKN